MHTDDKFTGLAVVGALLVTAAIFFLSHPGIIAKSPEAVSVNNSVSAPKPIPKAPKIQVQKLQKTDIQKAVHQSIPEAPVFASIESQSELNENYYANFITTLGDMSQGGNPLFGDEELPTMNEVLVRTNRDGRTVIAAGTQRRYENLVRAIEGLDVDEVNAALSREPDSLRHTFVQSLGTLLTAPIANEDPDMESKGSYWGFADDDYEALNMAQKHLLLMGRENARIVRTKLEEMHDAFDTSFSSPGFFESQPVVTQIANAQPNVDLEETQTAP